MSRRDRSREPWCRVRARGIRSILVTAALVALAFALAACGSPRGDPIAHPSEKSEVVLQLTTGGGLVPIGLIKQPR